MTASPAHHSPIRRTRRPRRAMGAQVLVALSLLALTACGSRLTTDEIVTAQSGAGVGRTLGAGGSGDVTGPGTGKDAAAGKIAGGGTPIEPGKTGPGTGTRLSAGGGAATGGAATGSAAGGSGPAGGGPAGGAAAIPGCKVTGTEPIVIGNLGNYSGALGSSAAQTTPTLQVFAKSVNDAGGICGHPIQVISKDTGGDSNRGRQQVQELIDKDNVVALVADNHASGGLEPIAEYAASKGVPMIGGESVADGWYSRPNLFPSGTSGEYANAGAAATFAAQGKKKIGVLFCAESPSCKKGADSFAKWAKIYGLEIAYSNQISITSPDYSSDCLQMKQAGVTGLFPGADGATVQRIADSCAQQGIKPLIAINSLALTEDFADNPNLDGAVLITGVFPYVDTSTEAAREFRAAMAKYASSLKLRISSSYTWAGAKMFEYAVKNATAKPSRMSLMDAMYTMKNETLGGLVPGLTFTAGKNPVEAHCWYVLQIRDKQFVAPQNSKISCPKS